VRLEYEVMKRWAGFNWLRIIHWWVLEDTWRISGSIKSRNFHPVVMLINWFRGSILNLSTDTVKTI
jgi:hypothetical protein